LVCLNRAAAQAATQTDLLFRTNLRIFVSSDEVHRCESYEPSLPEATRQQLNGSRASMTPPSPPRMMISWPQEVKVWCLTDSFESLCYGRYASDWIVPSLCNDRHNPVSLALLFGPQPTPERSRGQRLIPNNSPTIQVVQPIPEVGAGRLIQSLSKHGIQRNTGSRQADTQPRYAIMLYRQMKRSCYLRI
jgi:hypothetical protein